jgi:hypothetical protein
VRSFSIENASPVTVNAPINGAVLSAAVPPTFEFHPNCNVNFKLEFSSVDAFQDPKTIKGFTISTKDPNLQTIIKNTVSLGQWKRSRNWWERGQAVFGSRVGSNKKRKDFRGKIFYDPVRG